MLEQDPNVKIAYEGSHANLSSSFNERMSFVVQEFDFVMK